MKIRIGSKVQVLECWGENKDHERKVGIVDFLYGFGKYNVDWKKDGCIASKVRLIKAKKRKKEYWIYCRCSKGGTYDDNNIICKECGGVKWIQDKTPKKKVSKKDEKIYAFPHCGVDGCMECLNEADEEMDRLDKMPSKKQRLVKNQCMKHKGLVHIRGSSVCKKQEKQLLHQKYLEAQREWIKAVRSIYSLERKMFKAEQNYKNYKDI